MKNRTKEIMADVFSVSVNEINKSSSPRTIPSWKGRNHIKLIEALEKEFQIKFEECEIESLVNYKVITATLAAYLDD